MVRDICRDIRLLRRKSLPADENDAAVIADLRDTLRANRDRCIGMAANMIGVSKRIIILSDGMLEVVMVDPVITKKTGRYQTVEGCLSLTGQRKAVRYREIEVDYKDSQFRPQHQRFSGLTAQIIQHECDHLDGVII